MAGLKEFLIPGQLASHMFLLAPFNLDTQFATTRFLQTLREGAEEAGASFMPIEWLPEHGNAGPPHKHLNGVGKQLLVESFLRASQLPLGGRPVSGPSCSSPQPPPPSTAPLKKIPTRGSSSSSSSSSNRSSRVHQGGSNNSKGGGPPSGHEEKKTGSAFTGPGTSSQAHSLASSPYKACEICQSQGHHDSPNCPLVWACSMGASSDVEVVERAMAKLKKMIMPTPRSHQVVLDRRDITHVVAMPTDGNCLFAALLVGYKAISGKCPEYSQRQALGAHCRQKYLELVKWYAEQKREVLGLSVDHLLVDLGWRDLTEYLAKMEPPIASRRQWGGFAEAVIMGNAWKVQVAFFLELHGGNIAMMTQPVGQNTKGLLITPNSSGLSV